MEQNSGEVLHFRQRKRKIFCRFLSFVPIYGHSQHFSFFYYCSGAFPGVCGRGRGICESSGGMWEGAGCEVRDLGGIVYFATGICSFCWVLRRRSAGFAGFSVLRGRREQGRVDFFGRGFRVGREDYVRTVTSSSQRIKGTFLYVSCREDYVRPRLSSRRKNGDFR